MRRSGAFVVVVVALASTGCFVIPTVEYGKELGAQRLEPGEPFELRYAPVHGEDHRLWIDHTVEFQGWDFEIEGPLTVAVGTRVLRAVDVRLNAEDGPVDREVRVETGESEWAQWGDRVWLSATVFTIDVPGREIGSEVVLRGEWHASANVDVDALWLVVTD